MTDDVRCFVTGKPIPPEEMEGEARFTKSFDAWVSKEGQTLLKHEPEAQDIPELKKVIEEWDSQELDWYKVWKETQ